jgi:hypothetical protein
MWLTEQHSTTAQITVQIKEKSPLPFSLSISFFKNKSQGFQVL